MLVIEAETAFAPVQIGEPAEQLVGLVAAARTGEIAAHRLQHQLHDTRLFHGLAKGNRPGILALLHHAGHHLQHPGTSGLAEGADAELLDQARQKWPAWVAADPRLGVVDNFDDLRSWLPTVDHETSDQVLLALAMLAAPDGGDDIAAAAALAKCLLPGACRLAGWLSTLPPREVFRDSQPVAAGSVSSVSSQSRSMATR